MMKAKNLVILGCSMISGLCLAGPQDRHMPAPANATKKTAIEFIQGYYDHLDRGVSREHLDYYWTDDRTENLDLLAITIAGKTGKEPIRERQRLLDLQHMESRCEDLELTKANVYGSPSKKAKLKYKVKNHCKSTDSQATRTITLQYSFRQRHWLIDRIEDGGL